MFSFFFEKIILCVCVGIGHQIPWAEVTVWTPLGCWKSILGSLKSSLCSFTQLSSLHTMFSMLSNTKPFVRDRHRQATRTSLTQNTQATWADRQQTHIRHTQQYSNHIWKIQGERNSNLGFLLVKYSKKSLLVVNVTLVHPTAMVQGQHAQLSSSVL